MPNRNGEIPWHDVYPQLAKAINDIYKRKKEATGRYFYLRCKRDEVFSLHVNRLFNRRDNPRARSLDPVHLFGSFNQRRQPIEVRTVIMNALFKIAGTKKKFEHVDYSGCPAPFALTILASRESSEQEDIWLAFSSVYTTRKYDVPSEFFQYWYGLDIVSFSLFMFWIRPKYFLPLDKNTRKFFNELGATLDIPRSEQDYRNVLREKNTTLYIDIAKAAVDPDPESPFVKETIQRMMKAGYLQRATRRIKTGFRLIAIRPQQKLQQKYKKILSLNTLYSFYKEYHFDDNDHIRMEQPVEFRMYDKNVTLDICSVVGKNGSGKSSLWELLLVMLNNISQRCFPKNADPEYQLEEEDNIYGDFFYHTYTIKKISIGGHGIITVNDYNRSDSTFTPGRKRNFTKNDLREFFYTIAVSFSHYSLNELDFGTWIKKLFHKNDGYQVPVVLTPQRTDGNFNINNERRLMKSRLVANLLERVVDEGNNLRRLTDSGKVATHLELMLDEEKLDKYAKQYQPEDEEIFEYLKKIFQFDTRTVADPLKERIKKYLTGKVKKIVGYPQYRDRFLDASGKMKRKKISEFIKDLERDETHTTDKLRQAINYFKYNTHRLYNYKKKYEYDKKDERLLIENLSAEVDLIKSKATSEKRKQAGFKLTKINIPLKTIHLVPPSFLRTHIILDKEIDIDSLSSGEKQRIYTVSSLVYHLTNLNSVAATKNMIHYRYVNVILDEIELYFHPEMQRGFLNYIIRYLNSIALDNIDGIHLLLITHSPFVLSDIPASQVLFLAQNGSPVGNPLSLKTFGGNIHDLLADGFFFQDRSLMGEYARRVIGSAVNYLLNKIEPEKYPETKDDNEWNAEKLEQLIGMVGEPLIRKNLEQLYIATYTSLSEINSLIDTLQDLRTTIRRES
jgi:hypothetical protein